MVLWGGEDEGPAVQLRGLNPVSDCPVNMCAPLSLPVYHVVKGSKCIAPFRFEPISDDRADYVRHVWGQHIRPTRAGDDLGPKSEMNA